MRSPYCSAPIGLPGITSPPRWEVGSFWPADRWAAEWGPTSLPPANLLSVSCCMHIRSIPRADPRSCGPITSQPLSAPMLFFQGTRDPLSRMELFERYVRPLPNATVELIEADHSLGGAKNAPRLIGRTVEWIKKLAG